MRVYLNKKVRKKGAGTTSPRGILWWQVYWVYINYEFVIILCYIMKLHTQYPFQGFIYDVYIVSSIKPVFHKKHNTT